jgi:hypothetical protein
MRPDDAAKYAAALTHELTYIDKRMGKDERWSLGPPQDWLMRIPDYLLQSVCFIGVMPPNADPYWGGTAFFVGMPVEDAPEFHSTYLVTARHNIVKASAAAAQVNGLVCIRVNTTDGRSKVLTIPPDTKWLEPSAAGSDVAVLSWQPPDTMEYRRIGRQMFATPEVIAEHGIGLGDELNMVGLFTRRAGEARNEPILRTGVISAAASEPLINPENDAPMLGCYLAELRSIAGLSGSPVFVFLPFYRPNWGGRNTVESTATFYLLGLIHGHWSLDKKAFIDTDFGDGDEPLNTGIAVISPITDALALMESPDEVTSRAVALAKHRAKQAPTAD